MKTTAKIMMEAEVTRLVIDLIFNGLHEIKDLTESEKLAYIEAKEQEIIKMVREAQ